MDERPGEPLPPAPEAPLPPPPPETLPPPPGGVVPPPEVVSPPEAPAPPPPPSRPRFPVVIAVAVVIAAVAALATWLLLAGGGDGGTDGMSPSVGPTTSVSPTDTPTPTVDPRTRPHVRVRFARTELAEGRRIRLGVQFLVSSEEDCELNRFDGIPAYLSDCRSWERGGFDILLFSVQVGNDTGRPTLVDRNRFVLVDRRGRVHRPENVRSAAEQPAAFWALTERLRPGRFETKWLVFPAGTGYVPARLTYRDGSQLLSIVFAGRHSVGR